MTTIGAGRRCATSWQPKGYETLEASCGEEALDIVSKGVEVHLVLLDMHMPTLTGLETLQLVRQVKALLPGHPRDGGRQ